jgi:hypothetical protein
MCSNYQFQTGREALVALPHESIPADRPGAVARGLAASRDLDLT